MTGAVKQKTVEDENVPPPIITEEIRANDHFNRNDGLFHNQDGTKEFLDGGIVGGVNLAHGPKEEKEDKEAEEEEKNAEVNEIKEKIEKKEAEIKKMAEREACIKNRLKNLNPYDGLIHNEDGSREFVDGGIVEGANMGGLF